MGGAAMGPSEACVMMYTLKDSYSLWDVLNDSPVWQDRIFHVLAALYGIVAGVALVQLIRIQQRVPEYGWTTQKVFHFLNFLVNGARCVIFVFRHDIQHLTPEIARHMLLDLPSLAFFTTYALLVLFWTEIYYQARTVSTDGLRPAFFTINGIVYAIQDSLKALRDKAVYCLTLVKGWNTKDIDAYSSLFGIGNPDFVEIKGVTYCGTSATSKLTMENVPWHADVKAFSEALAQKSNGEYEVACEHVHSCCVLLGKVDKFKIDSQWHTWIDYEKFHDLVASGKPFGSNNYMAPTPSWAVYGADEGGFDPEQARYRKERNHKSNR